MAVKRAWVTREGEVLHQLTDEQMSAFLERVANGLYDIAYRQVLEEIKQEKKPGEREHAASVAASC